MSLRTEPKDIFESNKGYIKQILEWLGEEAEKRSTSSEDETIKLKKEIETYKNLINDLDTHYETSFIDYYLYIKTQVFICYREWHRSWDEVNVKDEDDVKDRALKETRKSWAIWYAFDLFEKELYDHMKEFDVINQPNGEADMLLDRLHELSTRLSGNYAKFSKEQGDRFKKLIKPNLEVIEKKFLEAQEHGESVMQIDPKGNIK